MTSNAKYVVWLFLTLRGLFKFKMRIPHENSSKASLKEPMWLITILAGLIQITRLISLNLAFLIKMRVISGRQNGLIETIIYLYG